MTVEGGWDISERIELEGSNDPETTGIWTRSTTALMSIRPSDEVLDRRRTVIIVYKASAISGIGSHVTFRGDDGHEANVADDHFQDSIVQLSVSPGYAGPFVVKVIRETLLMPPSESPENRSLGALIKSVTISRNRFERPSANLGVGV